MPSSRRERASIPRLGQRGDDRASIVRRCAPTSLDAHDRVADELAGAVVGDAPAAVGGDDLDPARAVEGLAERQLAVARASPTRVYGRVLEQQQRVGQLVSLALLADVLLRGKRLRVWDRAKVADPQLSA